ncbi:MAG: hypothetical protein IPN34_17570 [Planctomycetes bacterium]|nr:hypothetical protein [Planctomycetota bacterium]
MRANAATQPEVDKLTEVQVRELARSQAATIRELLTANEKLRALIFGRRSERYPFDDHPQLPFGDEPATSPAPPSVDDVPDEESDHVEHKRKKKRRSRPRTSASRPIKELRNARNARFGLVQRGC